MLPRPPAFVKLAPLVLAACAAPTRDRPTPLRTPGELAPVSRSARTPVRHGPMPHLDRRLSMHLDEVPRQAERAAFADEDTVMAELGADLDRADPGGGGEGLEAALDELPKARVDADGVAALTLDQLFGDTFHPGLCEDAELLVDLDAADGSTWNASLQVPSYMLFVSDPEPYDSELTPSCKTAIAETGGDLDAAVDGGGCVEDDIQQFFADGSSCRTCVEGNGGDFDACVEDEACHEEMPAVVWIDEGGEQVWYRMGQIYIYACAPDWTVLNLFLADIGDDGSMPPAFDHAAWDYLCLPYWDEDLDDVDWTCFSGEGGPETGDTMAEGVFGRVNWMHPDGDDTTDYYTNQVYYAHSVEMKSGALLRWFWGYASGAGVFSLPPTEPDSNGNGVYDIEDENYGYSLGGWGLDPYALRPDGTDPTRLDDTFARDWLGIAAMKFSTTRDGIPISTANYSRCLAWSDPADDGSRWCTEQGPPVYGWQNDVQNTWWDSSFTQAYPFPIVTLGSTGLPDPDIPGGIVPLVAGTAALADPEWDDCAWPTTFVPDRAPMEDTPADFGGVADLAGDTWDFAKPDAPVDLRAVLSTNQARGFCSEAP